MKATNTADAVPKPRTPGPEMEELARFYRNVTWRGTIEPGAMGPGSPPMTGVGRGVHTFLHGGLWIAGDYEQDQYLDDGSHVLTWQLHWVTGWDAEVGEYRATMNDNYGHADLMRGHIDGDRLIYESVGEPAVRIRLTWDLTEPDAPLWTNEASVVEDNWFLVETYRLSPVQTPSGEKPAE